MNNVASFLVAEAHLYENNTSNCWQYLGNVMNYMLQKKSPWSSKSSFLLRLGLIFTYFINLIYSQHAGLAKELLMWNWVQSIFWDTSGDHFNGFIPVFYLSTFSYLISYNHVQLFCTFFFTCMSDQLGVVPG